SGGRCGAARWLRSSGACSFTASRCCLAYPSTSTIPFRLLGARRKSGHPRRGCPTANFCLLADLKPLHHM
ncbi:MAG: hypothetical protein ABIZ56_01255, partial [Chthoniobacteraceae bacterium]